MRNINKSTEAKIIIKVELVNQTHLPSDFFVAAVLFLYCCCYDKDRVTKNSTTKF